MNIEQTLAMPASAAHLRARLVYAYEVGPLSGHSSRRCGAGGLPRLERRSGVGRGVGNGGELGSALGIASSGGIVDVDLPMTLKAQEICKRGDRFVLAGVA